MNYSVQTDLALESREMYKATHEDEVPGVEVEEGGRGRTKITRVKIVDERGVKEIGKPMGNYITLEMPQHVSDSQEDFEDVCVAVKDELDRLISLDETDLVLIVGLGNWNITPDALGPKVVDDAVVTRHIFELMPDDIGDGIRPVCAVSPGVLGITGIETSEIIKGVTEKVKPKLVIAIDALASRKMERVSTTIQIADTGINPGAGIGNKRNAINEETLGVPVIAIGVPTVVDAATMANDTIDLLLEHLKDRDNALSKLLKGMGDNEKYSMIEEVLSPTYMGNLIVTPKEVDEIIDDIAEIIANGINMALHPAIGIKDINKYA